MKILIVPGITVVLLGLGSISASAQTELPPPGDVKPDVDGNGIVANGELPVEYGGHPGPGCHHDHPAVKVLPVFLDKPITTLRWRIFPTVSKRPTLKIEYRPKKCYITEMIIKPIEVVRPVPYTVMEPCTVTDPHTGHCSTVMKPVTLTRLQKEVEFKLVPEEKLLVYQVPYLVKDEELVPQENILFEWQTELEPQTYAVPVPTTVRPDRYYITPRPHHPKCGLDYYSGVGN